MVPDHFWGFDSVGRTEHPGACVACSEELRIATLLKGRDALTERRQRGSYVIEPTRANGLAKLTAF